MSYRQTTIRKKEVQSLMRDVLQAAYHFEQNKEKIFGITYELYYAMVSIKKGKRTCISTFAKNMNIPVHKATRIVQRLYSKGLIKRETPLNDRRVVYVMLTHKGKESLKKIEDFCFETVLQNISHYSPDDVKELIRIAKTIPHILAIHPTTKEVCYAK